MQAPSPFSPGPGVSKSVPSFVMKRKLIEIVAHCLQLVIALATATAFQPKLDLGVNMTK